MNSIKSIFLFLVFIFSSCSLQAASTPYKDNELIQQLKNKNIRLIVLRHGQSTNSLKNRISSSRSPGVYLTQFGLLQMAEVAGRLRDDSVDVIYCSPLFRTQQAANVMGRILNIPQQLTFADDRLRLQTFGIYEGVTFDEFKSHFNSIEEMYESVVPGGELGIKVFERLRSLLWTIATSNENKTILLITHAFNCNHINKILTGEYGDVLPAAQFKSYQF